MFMIICTLRSSHLDLVLTGDKFEVKQFSRENLLNDGAKRNRLLYLKIMYTAIRKILYLQEILYI